MHSFKPVQKRFKSVEGQVTNYKLIFFFNFKCYENLDLHSCMMKDRQRVGFYYRAMTRNPDLFKGKTVLDVGSGLGILSLFAGTYFFSVTYPYLNQGAGANYAHQIILASPDFQTFPAVSKSGQPQLMIKY